MGIIFSNKEVIHNLKNRSEFSMHHLIEVPLQDKVDARLANHTDLSIFIHERIYAEDGLYDSLCDRLLLYFDRVWVEEHCVKCASVLNETYPMDCAFNAVKLQNHFFHRLSSTDPQIIKDIRCDQINVKQGYTRCSSLIVDDQSVITEDEKLAQAYVKYGYNTLKINAGHILLPGFPHGFFGGTGGRIEDALLLNGSLKHHPNGSQIKEFIINCGLKVTELHEGPLVDCGSILYFP